MQDKIFLKRETELIKLRILKINKEIRGIGINFRHSEKKVKSIGFLGAGGGICKEKVNIPIIVPSDD